MYGTGRLSPERFLTVADMTYPGSVVCMLMTLPELRVLLRKTQYSKQTAIAEKRARKVSGEPILLEKSWAVRSRIRGTRCICGCIQSLDIGADCVASASIVSSGVVEDNCDLFISTFPSEELLKEENRKLWYLIVNYGVEKLDKHDGYAETARYSSTMKPLLEYMEDASRRVRILDQRAGLVICLLSIGAMICLDMQRRGKFWFRIRENGFW